MISFQNFSFYIQLPKYQSNQVIRIIQSLKGHYSNTFQYDKTTHIITDNLVELSRDILKLNSIHKIVVIRKKWVYDCLKYNRILPVNFYLLDSPYSNMKGCKILTFNLSKEDQLKVQAWIELYGGKFRTSFEERYTHLITDDISKFQKQNYSLPSKLNIVSIEWFNQCVLYQNWVSEQPFQLSLPSTSKKLFSSFSFFIPNDIYSDSIRNAITDRINQYGGTIVSDIHKSNLIVIQYQSDSSFEIANKLKSKIVTTDWIHDCVLQDRIIKLTESILYQPIKSSESVLGKDCKYRISVSKYDGIERDHIKGMIEIIGAQYTSELSSENTHLVSRYNRGAKYHLALELGIKIVSKQWLESIILNWKELNTDSEQ